MSISTAVGLNRLSTVVGYKIKPGNFLKKTPNLPAMIAVLAEGNTANQGSMTDGVPVTITSAKEAGDKFGYGSPIHQILRILKPLTGGGVGGIPVMVYPQLEAGGAAGAVRSVTVTGTVTKNGSHSLVINGRSNVDGQKYNYTLSTDDTVTTIAAKMADAVNSVVGSPVVATSALGVLTLTSKYAGLVSEQLEVRADTFDNTLGLAYAVASVTVGSGTPSLANAIANWGNEWKTLVINSYDADAFSDLETLNGTPDDDFASGQYAAIKFKPFVAFWGSKLSTVAGITAITDVAARKTQVTNVLAPAPNSEGGTFEASANMCRMYALSMQTTPELDISGQKYPDMPIPSNSNIGDFAIYDNRDIAANKGASNVNLENGAYVVKEALTSYRPDGEVVPQWRYVRSIIQDWNVRFAVLLLEQAHVIDHLIANDDDVVEADKVIKPKELKSLIMGLADSLTKRGIIVDAAFMKDSIEVGIGEANPDRMESSYSYKRSGFARISSTTAEAGFNFGS